MPTVTIGENTGNDFSGTDDVELRLDAPNTNHGSATSIQATKYAVGNHSNSLIRFTGLSNITGPVTVSAATLYLYKQSSGGNNIDISARKLLRNFVEGQATWNIYSTGNSWTTAGGISDGNDRVGTAVATADMGAQTSTEYKAFTSAGLIALVEDWINGSEANNGLHMERTDSGDDTGYTLWTSSEGADGQRPYLEVTYTAGGGAPVHPFTSVTVTG